MSETLMRIGLILKNLDEEYQCTIYNAILKEAEKRQVTLLCIQGESFHSVQKNSTALFPSRHFLNLDGVLLLSSIIINNQDDQLHTLQECFSSIPAVSIGRKLNKIPSVIVDTDTPFRELMDHLFTHHSYQKYLYLGGPEGNWDSQNRERVFLESLEGFRKKNKNVEGSVLRGEMFSQRTGANLISRYLERHPQRDIDVIVAGSDTMALGALRFLNSQEDSSWKDCPITGFDDIPMAGKNRPSLTTVRQPLLEMGKKALQLLLEQISTSKAQLLTHIPGQFLQRRSCSCSGEEKSPDAELFLYKERQFLRSNSFFAQILMTARNYRNILEGLKEFLENLGIACFSLLLFTHPDETIPEKARLLYEKQGLKSSFYCDENKIQALKSFFIHPFPNIKRENFQLYHLHYGKEQLGLMFFSAEEEKLPYMTSCGLFLSNSIKSLQVLEKEQAYAQELEYQVEQRTRAWKEENKKRMQVEAEILKISDLERMRFSMDLHDDICQRLAGITMISKNAAADSPLMQTLWEMSSETLRRTRQYAYDSFPVELDSMGLEESLLHFCDDINKKQDVQCQLTIQNPPVPEFPQQVQINLYRIAQEAIHNALKHSKGDKLNLLLDNSPAGFCMYIDDNGVGNPLIQKGNNENQKNKRRPRGLGLRSMEYRTRQMNGQFRIESSPSGGTRIFVRLENKENSHE